MMVYEKDSIAKRKNWLKSISSVDDLYKNTYYAEFAKAAVSLIKSVVPDIKTSTAKKILFKTISKAVKTKFQLANQLLVHD